MGLKPDSAALCRCFREISGLIARPCGGARRSSRHKPISRIEKQLDGRVRAQCPEVVGKVLGSLAHFILLFRFRIERILISRMLGVRAVGSNQVIP